LLQLFSRETILAAFRHFWNIELCVIFPWFLPVSGLTTEGVSPRSRCDMFEIAFYMLGFYGELMKMVKLSPNTKKKIGQ
jgi:hypothetical protein